MVDAGGGGEPRKLLADLPYGADNPTWSPDGTKIAFDMPTGEIGIVDLADGELSTSAEWGFSSASQPTWSPDGSELVFAGATEADVTPDGRIVYDLFVVADGGDVLMRVTETPGEAEDEPAWSPDGDSIAFVRTGQPGIFSLDVQDGDVVTLTTEKDTSPTWTPDGVLVFVRFMGYRQTSPGVSVPRSSIMMLAEGGDEFTLVPAETELYDVAWSPAADEPQL